MSNYVCRHCECIYVAYPPNLRCDLCGRKIKFLSTQEIERLEVKWNGKVKQDGNRVVDMERRKGMNSLPLSERLPERIFSRVHQDIGEASTCWSNLDGAGAFDTEHAAKIAFELCHSIADELDRVRLKGTGYGGSKDDDRMVA